MSTTQSTPTLPTSNPDLVTLATSLQEIAQSLLVHAPKEPEDATAGHPSIKNDGETRAFYFPPSSVHMEKELLRKYRANDFQGLLEVVHILLVGLVKLMQSVHKDARVRGMLSQAWEHRLTMLPRLYSVCVMYMIGLCQYKNKIYKKPP